MRAGSPPPYVGPPPVPKMPAGLVDLVEGLTREVLKNNPKNIYEFCAKHLEKLLESRDGRPFKKPMLTLEQKIHEAQEKVRQKAKERRERYDREMNTRSNNTELPTMEVQQIAENNTSKSETDVSIINAMPPIHHEKGLKPDSEVEIAHEASYIADEKKTFKIENVEEKKEKVKALSQALTLTLNDNSNTDLPHGKDMSKEDSINAETMLPGHDDKTVENNANDADVDIISAMDNAAISPTDKEAENNIANDTNVNIVSATDSAVISPSNKAADHMNANETKVNTVSAMDNVAISPTNKVAANINAYDSNVNTISATDNVPISPTNNVAENINTYDTNVNTVSATENAPISPTNNVAENINANDTKVNTLSAKDKAATSPTNSVAENIHANDTNINTTSATDNVPLIPSNNVAENINANDTNINITSAMDNAAISPKLQGQYIAPDIKEDSANTHHEKNITDETESVPITHSLKEENTVKNDNSNIKDSKNNSLSSIKAASDIKDDSNSTVPINENVSTKKSAESQREPDLLTVTEQLTLKDYTKFNKDETPLVENILVDIDEAKKSDNIKKEENNERVIEMNLHGTKKVDSLSENRDELLNENVIEREIKTSNLTLSAIEDTSIILRNTTSEDINVIVKDITNNEMNANPRSDVVVVPESVGKDVNALDKEIADSFYKTAKIEEELPKLIEKNGTETPSAELQISMTTTLNANVTEHTNNIKEVVIKETPIQEEHTDNDDLSVQVSKNSEIINYDNSSLVGSDLSKIEEDTTGENQNEQPNMDLETAAVTIQKVFRTFLFKSRNSTFDDGTNDEGTSLDEDSDNIKKEEYYAAANLNKERRPLGISRMDTVLQTVNEEKSLSLSTDDSSTLSSAATTIQAHVRGFLVRNRLNSNKTVSTNSVNSNELLEPDTEQQKNKTVLNIHIVPEEGNYLSRDESIITSMELSLDGSPPSSVNLHPLSHDVSERRKLLKREDAVQSISPPSNNSGKLSEESVKELFINEETVENNVELKTEEAVELNNDSGVDSEAVSISSTATATTIINVTDLTKSPEHKRSKSLQNMDHDESDVITPYVPSPRSDSGDYENSSKLVHSGEFHDALLPTRVARNNTSVVREFKNVLVYFIIWNH